MASMWRKAMLYLGLGPDDEYEDYEAADDGSLTPPATSAREPASVTPRSQGERADRGERPGSGPARPPAGPPPSPAEPEASAIRTLPGPGPVEPAAAKPRPVVRPVPAAASAKPHVVSPTSFNHAQEVADKFKISQPVILNLQGVGRDLARRLIDFSSGLCYGLGGHMEKVAHQVYLLTPTNVEVSAEERRRLQERGLHDA
jgi:cell division inhibitor SepF